MHRFCSLASDGQGRKSGCIALGSAMVRLLDLPGQSSEDEAEEPGTSRSEGSSGSKSRPRARRLFGGRLKRASSAPVPPLLGLLSRTGGCWLESSPPPTNLSARGRPA